MSAMSTEDQHYAPSTADALMRRLDRHPRGLTLSVTDLCNGHRYEWNGAHTVNIYTLEGENIDVYSFGDFAENAATVEQFLASVLSHVDEAMSDQ